MLLAATFSNVPSSAVPGATLGGTWSSATYSISGDWIGLMASGGAVALWDRMLAAGLNTGTFVTSDSTTTTAWTMPNSPGSIFYFVYVRGTSIVGTSNAITCSSSPTHSPATIPTLLPTRLPTKPTLVPTVSTTTPGKCKFCMHTSRICV